MLTLVHSNDNIQPVTERERGYDIGYGRATMDKCSGLEARALDNIAESEYNAGYIEGYLDGYCSNDARM